VATAVTAQTAQTNSLVANQPITALATTQTRTNATTLVQNQGSAGSQPRSGNPPQGFAGPSPHLATVNRPSADALTSGTPAGSAAGLNQTLGLVSRNTAVQTLFGAGSGTNAVPSERDRLTDLQGSTAHTNRPAFDQGFTSRPASLASNPLASRTASGAATQSGSAGESGNSLTSAGSGGSSGSPASLNRNSGSSAVFNPMDAFRGGSVGGPLGTAATASQKAPTPGSGAAGSGLVSDAADDINNDVRQLKVGFLKDTANDILVGAGVAGTLAGVATLAAAAPALPFVAGAGLAMAVVGSGAYLGARIAETYFSTPNPENTGSNINILTQSLLNQLNAANAGKPVSQGGSGDITPVTNAGMDGVVRNGSIASNQASLQGQNLFGQPVNPAVDNNSGGNKGINSFRGSSGAGVINPGQEAGSPGGDARFQQDPARVFGGSTPAPAGPSLPASQSSPSEQTSSVSTTLVAGVRNLTLTGTAVINGSGNALDNQINGNGAANELRGEAGDDSLNGQAGNDRLDGGSGRDLLTGGTGADRFLFSTAGGFGIGQADRITDFNRSEGDRIEISRSAFGLATTASLSFQAVSSDADLSRALAGSTLLVQDLRDGSILFNQNGAAAGVGQGGVFAVVHPGLSLQIADFAPVA